MHPRSSLIRVPDYERDISWRENTMHFLALLNSKIADEHGRSGGRDRFVPVCRVATHLCTGACTRTQKYRNIS